MSYLYYKNKNTINNIKEHTAFEKKFYLHLISILQGEISSYV